jgi:hypothetical protein
LLIDRFSRPDPRRTGRRDSIAAAIDNQGCARFHGVRPVGGFMQAAAAGKTPNPPPWLLLRRPASPMDAYRRAEAKRLADRIPIDVNESAVPHSRNSGANQFHADAENR